MPAVIDAVIDRLRPLMLTTLTTVIGLAPLLYETSQQAQFLRPTVIELVFGLGFGYFIVLLLVPALLVAQQDFSKMWASLWRGYFGRATPRKLRAGLWLVSLAIAALLAFSVGYYVVEGALYGPVAALGQRLPFVPEAVLAMLVLVFGSLLLLLLAMPGLAAISRRRRAG